MEEKHSNPTKEEILRSLDIKAYCESELPDIKWNEKQGLAKCPFHDDHDPSLSIDPGTGHFYCFGCSEKGSVFDFYMKKHEVSFSEAKRELARIAGVSETKAKTITAIYDYTDEHSKLLYQVVRTDPKGFRQRRPDGNNGWIYNIVGVIPTLYNLPELIKAKAVFVVEGEKDVETLRKIGITATTNSGGAGKWHERYGSYLSHKHVVIVPDNDEVGRKHAEDVAKHLSGVAKSVKVLHLPDLPEKGDISDWLEKGGTKEDLFALVKECQEWDSEANNILSQLFRWDDIATLDISTEWLFDGLIPKGAITLVFCPGGGGKTWLLMQIARAIATGESFGHLQTIQTPVYFIDFENPLSVVKERRQKIGPAANFWYWHLACPTGPRRLDSAEWEDYKQLPPGLIIFDTLRASHLGDENSSKDMALVLSRLKELRELGFTIIILHHTPKGNEGTYKGSTAILDLADHVLSLEKQSKKDDDEFDPDAIYKFGCRIKTRFEPNSIFLSFDPEIGFTTQEDPDIKTMKIMADILKKEGRDLNQKEFRETLENKLEMKKTRAFKLLKKGIGTFWKYEKGDHNSNVYSCLPSVFQFSALIKGRKTQKTETDNFSGNGKHITDKCQKTVDGTEFTSFPEGNGKTEKHDFDNDPDFIPEIEGDDAPHSELRGYIDHYLSQGLSRADAIDAAKGELQDSQKREGQIL